MSSNTPIELPATEISNSETKMEKQNTVEAHELNHHLHSSSPPPIVSPVPHDPTQPAYMYQQHTGVSSVSPPPAFSQPVHQQQHYQNASLPDGYHGKGIQQQQQPQMMQPGQTYMHQQQPMYQSPSQPQMMQQQHQQSPYHSQQQQQPMQASQAPAPNQTQYQNAVPLTSLGMSAAPVDCPICHQRRMTSITYHAGNTTHLWAGVTFCFTLCLCFIPYMINGLKDVQHRCGNCGTHLVTWHKSGTVDVHVHA